MGTNRLLSPLTLLLICTARCVVRGHEQLDAREGDDVTMECRFAVDNLAGVTLTYFWVRTNGSGQKNIAIANVPLQKNYQLLFAPSEGQYDLLMSNVSYEYDNGEFECRVKVGGSGSTLHAQNYILTVLMTPRAPALTPGSYVQSQEERELNLSCSSSGGSPEPTIKWYREGSTYPMEAKVVHAKTRSEPTVATLTLMPTKQDDGAVFRCVVWNRAMSQGQQLEASVELSVNYFPRVAVAPENPLRVEIDGVATMECKVDAKPKVSSIKWNKDGKHISNSFTHVIQGVTVLDAGNYTCIANNGLGRAGEKDMYLDVLFPPTVSVESRTYEAEEGGNVEIHCKVSANPDPISIDWTKEGNPEFRQSGNTLRLTRVNANGAGTYTCKAVNVISTSSGKRKERESSVSVAVLVRHRPGHTEISPDRPVAQEGAVVTLTCSAKPPGWPAPQYRWYRDWKPSDTNPTVLATGSHYSIPSVNLGSEGIYNCQATNELGHGDLASVTLHVHQPPRLQTKLQNYMTKRSGEEHFSVTCSALGKPRPSVMWLKNKVEIKPDNNLYEVKTEVTENGNLVYIVQSTLKFHGKARPKTNDLLPDDKGSYTCDFVNEVKHANSTMYLRIEHEPISIQLQKKVAYDVMETAKILCRVQVYPEPDFQWFYGSNKAPLMSSDKHYNIHTTTNSNGEYLSTLQINTVKPQDYGDYFCKVINLLGSIRPKIKLQPKGAPEPPRSLESQKVGARYVTLKWEAGFNGGLLNTKYFVWYRQLSFRETGAGATSSEHCAADRHTEFDWMEYDCGQSNPCNVTRLDQHITYSFAVKAVNTKGQSNYSNEITVTTKVDKINPPEQFTYDPNKQTMVFTVAPTCLSLVGVVEGISTMGGSSVWQVIDTINLQLSGALVTVQEANIELASKAMRKTAQYATDLPHENEPKIRLKLCLQVNHEVCSEYTDAEIGPSYIKEPYGSMTAAIVGIFVTASVLITFVGLAFLIYQCRRRRNKDDRSRDHEMDSMSPTKVSPQNQAPPPYYPSSGMENKALESSIDSPSSIDDSKSQRYGAIGAGYYHVPTIHTQNHPGQNMPISDWNIGFIENSYTNSNNGGSVNSQDSLWQMKMQTSNNAGTLPSHQVLDQQSNYDYDPISHTGYRGIDDYAPYSHLPHASQTAPPADYDIRATQNPSRQEYCSDPYASVHKPKKRIDQHIESPYHEVSGLPEYGLRSGAEEGGGDEKPLHMSLGYDESLESGYSTPNSRTRRVIREIIV